MTRKYPILFALILSLKISFGQKIKVESPKLIQNISLYNLNGDTSNLLEISKGKITFIDFWFIPCGPCFEEMNMLHKLYDKYKNNSNVSFLTITLTDTAFVRPLIENRNTDSNQTFKYFNALAKLDTFKLPVFFIKGVELKMKSFRKANLGFSGHGAFRDKNSTIEPSHIFGFSGYPTILIYDRKGKIIYKKTAFTKSTEKVQQKQIEQMIDGNL